MDRKARISITILLTLMPWPAVWFGMYKLHSIVLTFFLYHFVCLLPPIILRRSLWMKGMRAPQGKEWLVLGIGAVAFALAGIITYRLIGPLILQKSVVLAALTSRGYNAAWLMPLSIYFIVVNATMEELFWRGVIFNELKFEQLRWRILGSAWTAVAFAAWHYLVLRALLNPGWLELVIVGLVAVGWFSGWIYEKSGSIIVPILWHSLVFDLTVIVLFVMLVIS